MQLNLNSTSRNISPKTRQWLLLSLLGLTALVVLYIVFAISDKPTSTALQPNAPSKPSTFVQAPGAHIDPKDRWLGAAGRDVAQLQKDHEAHVRETAELRSRLESLQKQYTNQAQGTAATPVTPAPLPAPDYPPQAALIAGRTLPPPPPPPALTSIAPTPAHVPASALAPGTGLVRVAISTASGKQEPAGEQKSTKPVNDATGKTIDNYLPVSITQAVLLGGLDAPTGGQAQSNPQPVILRLVDSAILPNQFRSQVKECFVIGAGYGDISSERAYIRTENLSCIRHDGKTLEVKIQGSIFDETGKVGMKGRLVEKQGQLLARALLAGVLSGVGQAFQLQASTTSISPLGSTTSVNDGKELQAGIGAGVGRALDRLAQYYISLAERIFPVIEVDNGRLVDVVLTKGVVLEGWDAPPEAKQRPTGNVERVVRRMKWSDDDD